MNKIILCLLLLLTNSAYSKQTDCKSVDSSFLSCYNKAIITVEGVDMKWTVPIQQKENSEEMYLTFPEEMLEYLGWKDGDTVVWTDNNDGTWSIRLKDKTGKKLKATFE